MESVTIEQARARLGRLVLAAMEGEMAVITRHGAPAAVIAPIPDSKDPDADVVAVRMAAGMMQFATGDEETWAAFRRWLLREGGETPLGLSRGFVEGMTLGAARGAYVQFVQAMTGKGFS